MGPRSGRLSFVRRELLFGAHVTGGTADVERVSPLSRLPRLSQLTSSLSGDQRGLKIYRFNLAVKMADGGCYQAEGPLLALSRLTGVTGIWLGGCLAVCTPGSCAPTFPSPLCPAVTSHNSILLEARHHAGIS